MRDPYANNGRGIPDPESGRMELPGTVEGYEAGEREYARDLFAASAMQALVTVGIAERLLVPPARKPAHFAREAYDIADAMMAERDKRRQAGG